MAAHKYYSNEKQVFKDVYGYEVSDDVAKLAVARLAKSLGVSFVLKFRGRGGGRYNTAYRMTLCHNPSLGLIAHELAHAVQHQLKGLRRDGRRTEWHGDQHWSIMKDIIDDIRARGWLQGKLEAELQGKAQRSQAAADAREAREAARDHRAELIERRREQVVRLERKIKALTTRMKSAKRSLAALERAAAKKKPEPDLGAQPVGVSETKSLNVLALLPREVVYPAVVKRSAEIQNQPE